jgi:hypothetical protein
VNLKKFSILAALFLSMTISGTRAGFAQLQPLQPQDPDWLVRMYEDGWQKVQEGVLQRGEGGTQVETFTYGEEGLRWHVAQLEEKVSFLESLYNNQPDPDLADVIDHLRGEILASNARLESGDVGEAFAGEQLDNCDISYGGHAYADPLGGSQAPGVTANASAYFHNNCGYVGDTFAHAYVQATTGTVSSTKTQDDPKYGGAWLDSAAQWSLGGSTGCYSEAYAAVNSSALNISYTTQDTNYICPIPPVLTVSGPTDVYTNDYGTPCATVTWTASASDGTTPYSTINWYIGNTYQGSGSSLSKTYCNSDYTLNVKATVSDSQGLSAEGNFTTHIYYEISDPCAYGGCSCGGGYDPRHDVYQDYYICQ